MAVLCWPWKGAQADLALRAYVASDAITPCKGRWKTCLRGAGGSHLSPPPHTAGHGRLGPAVLPCPSARDAHRGEEDGARSTSPSSGNAAASLPALPISSSISWGAESQLAAHSQPQPREGFSLQPSQSCHDPYGLAAARGSSLRDASGQRRARGWWRCFQPAPGYRGARGTTASARGARPTPAGKTCRGGSAESTVLCVAMGTECRCANCFSFLSFFFHLFFFFLFARHCNTYYVSTSGACSGGEGGFVPCHALGSQRSPRAGRLPAGGVHPAAGPLPWASPRSYGQKQQPLRKKSDHIITNLTFQREARIKSKAEKIERGREREREKESYPEAGGFRGLTRRLGRGEDLFGEGACSLHPPRAATPRSLGVNFDVRLTDN